VPEEVWKVILSEEPASGGAAGNVAKPIASKEQQEVAQETKKASPIWANVGKFIAGLLPAAGMLVFIIQMVRRSRVFTTFMDNLIIILSAVVDILLIPLIPILAQVLKFMIGFLPFAMELSKKFTAFLKDPWEGIKKIFSGIGNIAQWIFNFLGQAVGKIFSLVGGAFGDIGSDIADIFSSVGGRIGNMFGKVGEVLGESGEKIWDIMTNKGMSFWEKLKAIGIETWNTIKEIAKIVFGTIRSIWEKDIIPFIMTTYKEVKDWIINLWDTKIWPKIENIYDQILAWYKANLEPLFNDLKVIVSTMASILRPLVSLYKNFERGVTGISQMLSFQRSTWGFFMKGLKSYIPGLQYGTSAVPQTGLYMLHKGEIVIPPEKIPTVSSISNKVTNQYTKPININNVFNISGEISSIFPRIRTIIDESLKESQMRGYI